MEGTPRPSRENHRKLSLVVILIGLVVLIIAVLAGISENPPGIVSMTGGSFAILLGLLSWHGKPGARTPSQQLLYWAPRASSIAVAAFISLFALDVFGESRGLWESLLGLVRHLIPTFLILAVLALSWRREWFGGIVLVALALLFAIDGRGGQIGGWINVLLISGPLALTGVLFLASWFVRGALRDTSSQAQSGRDGLQP